MRPLLTAVVFLCGAVVAAPLPKEPPVPEVTKAHITISQNNLKQIGTAFHNFSSANQDALPGDILDKNGKPLLSWRVAILPYVEQETLYGQFKLDEPWDSKNNKPLIEKMPKLYAPIRVKAPVGTTFYQTFTGKDTLFDKHKPQFNIGNIPDGVSNTALVIEAGEPVVWTKPIDIAYDAKKPVPKLGGMFDGVANVARGDGEVFTMKKCPDDKELRKFITVADQEATATDKLLEK